METTAPSIENDLRYLNLAVEQLEDYLLSAEIYWTGGVYLRSSGEHFPSLTLGWVLFYLQRAQSLVKNPTDQARMTRLRRSLDTLRTKWRHAWEMKAQAEFSSRLRLWRDFLEEYRHDRENNHDRYRYEVQKRALLDLLRQEAGEVQTQEGELLASLDALLRACFIPGDFIWNTAIQGAFPADRYWYLYGNLAKK